MPQSQYLQGGDLAAYGVPTATAAQIGAASTLVDAYLMRPEGLVYDVDGQGLPAWMAALDPVFTLHLSGAIAPGQNVVANFVETAVAASLQPGQVLILDRQSTAPDVSEAVVVLSVSGSAVTLKKVVFEHSGGATADTGLVVEEERVLPNKRPKGRVAHWPVARLLSGKGRYGLGRRSEVSGMMPMEDFSLLSAFKMFGGPPLWELMDVSLIDVEPGGDFWIPAGVFLAYYTRVYLAFVAGYPFAALPPEIKQATATLILNNAASQAMPQTFKSAKAGDTQITKFAATLIDDDTKSMLARYRVRQFI